MIGSVRDKKLRSKINTFSPPLRFLKEFKLEEHENNNIFCINDIKNK